MGFLDYAPFIGDVLKVGSSLLGLKSGSDAQEKSLSMQESQFNANMAMQREFAENGVRMRVADAKAAGVSPLVALGANPLSFSPVSTFSDYGSARDFDSMGQSLKDLMKGLTGDERRIKEIELGLAEEKLKQAGLETLKLEREVNQTAFPANTDPVLIPGQAQGVRGFTETDLMTGRTVFIPSATAGGSQAMDNVAYQKSQVPLQDSWGIEAGIPASGQYYALPESLSGQKEVMIGKTQNFGESSEDDLATNTAWTLARIGGWFNGYMSYKHPRDFPGVRQALAASRPRPVPGGQWRYNHFKSTWVLVPYDGKDQLYYYDHAAPEGR